MLASSKPIHCFSPLSRKLDVGWPRIEDFQLRGHSCVNNVQRCLCHFYTWMRHSKQTATLLLTKRHANFDTSTSAKGYVRACVRTAHAQCSPWHTACSGLPHNALHSSSIFMIIRGVPGQDDKYPPTLRLVCHLVWLGFNHSVDFPIVLM